MFFSHCKIKEKRKILKYEHKIQVLWIKPFIPFNDTFNGKVLTKLSETNATHLKFY